MVFQAETEDDLLAWIRVFENAKNHAMSNSQNQPTPPTKVEEAPMKEQIVYPTPEMDALARNVASEVLLMSCPYTLPSEEISDSTKTAGGRLYYTLQNIHLVPFVQGNAPSIIPLSSVKQLELKREDRLYPLLQIEGKGEGKGEGKDRMLEMVLMATPEESDLLEQLPQAIGRYGSDAQDLLDRLYRQNGKILQAEDPNESTNVQGYDLRVPQEITMNGSAPLPQVPEGTVEQKEVDFKLNLPAHVVFEMLFVKPQVLTQLHDKRRSLDVEIGEWSTQPPQTQSTKSITYRLYLFNCRYRVPLDNPLLKAKDTPCKEVLTLLQQDPYLAYLVGVRANTPEAPYGDTFQVHSYYTISALTRDTCRITAHIGIQWNKSPLVKSIIRGTTFKKYKEYARDLKGILQEHARQINRSSKKVVVEEVDEEDKAEQEEASTGFSTVHVAVIALTLVFLLYIVIAYNRRPHPNLMILSKEQVKIGKLSSKWHRKAGYSALSEQRLEPIAKVLYQNISTLQVIRQRDALAQFLYNQLKTHCLASAKYTLPGHVEKICREMYADWQILIQMHK